MTREIADFLQSGLIEIAGESLKPADVPHPASKMAGILGTPLLI
jgi:hypothetical protein